MAVCYSHSTCGCDSLQFFVLSIHLSSPTTLTLLRSLYPTFLPINTAKSIFQMTATFCKPGPPVRHPCGYPLRLSSQHFSESSITHMRRFSWRKCFLCRETHSLGDIPRSRRCSHSRSDHRSWALWSSAYKVLICFDEASLAESLKSYGVVT